MSDPFSVQLPSLLSSDILSLWNDLTAQIDALYDMDRLWNKGFGCWNVEYKYRRGGKTLCTLYAKQGEAVILVTLGKAERDKFDAQRSSFSEPLTTLYDNTQTYHDGKWLWIPIDGALCPDDIRLLLQLKRRPNRK